MKRLAKPSVPSTTPWKSIIGLTILFFILKSLGNR